MTRYLGRAQNGLHMRPGAFVYVAILAWAAVACAFLWFSCCGGMP